MNAPRRRGGHNTSATSAKASFGRVVSMTLCAPSSFAPAPSGAITHDAPHARAASRNFSSSTNTTSPRPASSIEATPPTCAPASPTARPPTCAASSATVLPSDCLLMVPRSARDFEEEFALGGGRLGAGLAREAPARGAYESGEVRDVLVAHLVERFERAPERQTRAEQELVRALQGGARLRREAAAPESYRVQPAHARRVAVRREERQNVLDDLRLAAGHRVAPEADELVRAHVRRQEDMILDDDVSGQCRAVGEHVVVAHLAVVRDVDADH